MKCSDRAFLVVGIALLMEHIGLSPALGTFVAGVFWPTQSIVMKWRPRLASGLLLALFFISMGLRLTFLLLMENHGPFSPWLADWCWSNW